MEHPSGSVGAEPMPQLSTEGTAEFCWQKWPLQTDAPLPRKCFGNQAVAFSFILFTTNLAELCHTVGGLACA